MRLGKRRVGVHRGGAVLVVQRHVFERGNLPAEVRAGRVREPAAEVAGGRAEALRKVRGLRVEQDARGLQRAGAEDHDARGGVLFLAGLLVDEMDASRAALRVERDLARHRVGDDVEVARLQRGRDEHGRAIGSSP